MFNLNFAFIAYRYLRVRINDSTISFMLRICFLGIFIASCSVALVISIMTGFERATYEKMQSIYPDIILESKERPIDMQLLAPALKNEFPGVMHFSSQQSSQVILSSINNNIDGQKSPCMICLKAIDPQKESNVSTLQNKIIAPFGLKLNDILQYDHVIIGSKLADTLDLKEGNKANVLYTNDEPSGLKITFQQVTVIIAGIFKTGVEEFDNNLMYCSTNFFDDLFPEEDIFFVHLKCDPTINKKLLIAQLKKQLEIDAYAWTDLYPALISALKLEKMGMFFILMLIVFVASMNIASLIFMFVTQKKRDLAILLCLGMPERSLRLIFTTMSFIISILASLLGLLTAYIVGKGLQTFPFIALPDNIYDTDYLPVHMEASLFLTIFLITIMISLLASLLATKNVATLNIIETLKNQ